MVPLAVGALALVAAGAVAALIAQDPPGPGGTAADPAAPSLSGAPGTTAMVPPPPGVTATGAAPAGPGPAATRTGTVPAGVPGVTPTTATTTGAVTPTVASPAPVASPDAPEAEVRTFTSAGGSVEATCTDADLAVLNSYDPARSYSVSSADTGPAEAAEVVFRHGNDYVTMTVTCAGGVPSVRTTQEAP